MSFNFREIPHPQYGNYGGSRRRCASAAEYLLTGVCPLPISQIDKDYLQHDHDNADPDDVLSDAKLVGNLFVDLPGVLNPWEKYGRTWQEDLYGRAYHVGSLVVFAAMMPFTTPARLCAKLFRRN